MNVTRLLNPNHAVVTDAIHKLAPGQAIIYHTGSLMFDRSEGAALMVIHGVGRAAWEAYEKGEVTLVQRKISPVKFEYLAIRNQRKGGLRAGSRDQAKSVSRPKPLVLAERASGDQRPVPQPERRAA